MWLFEPLRVLPDLSDTLHSWVVNYLSDAKGDLVRARAALTLGEKQLIGADALREIYGTVRSAVRPEVVWAIAKALPPNDRLVRSATGESQMARWVVETAGQ
jgi:hypothetical protein